MVDYHAGHDKEEIKGKKLRSTAHATRAPTVVGKMLGGTKWYLSAFHHAEALDKFAGVIFRTSHIRMRSYMLLRKLFKSSFKFLFC